MLYLALTSLPRAAEIRPSRWRSESLHRGEPDLRLLCARTLPGSDWKNMRLPAKPASTTRGWAAGVALGFLQQQTLCSQPTPTRSCHPRAGQQPGTWPTAPKVSPGPTPRSAWAEPVTLSLAAELGTGTAEQGEGRVRIAPACFLRPLIRNTHFPKHYCRDFLSSPPPLFFF